MTETNIYLSLGSNIGDREKYLETTIKELEKIIKIEKISSIYETEAEDYEEQDNFLNLAIKGKTNLSPKKLLKETQRIEEEIGRQKIIEKGPRTIDIDILFYGDQIIETETLKIPHKGIEKRKFVLVPLAEIDENINHPILNKSINSILKSLKSHKEVKVWTQKK
jgi:2-amino-4-hydroxy-6-hydroxymethyldihydropteridine diphosphokinase